MRWPPSRTFFFPLSEPPEVDPAGYLCDGFRSFITTEFVEENGQDVTTDEIVTTYAKFAKKR
jgi:hypothetical protein